MNVPRRIRLRFLRSLSSRAGLPALPGCWLPGPAHSEKPWRWLSLSGTVAATGPEAVAERLWLELGLIPAWDEPVSETAQTALRHRLQRRLRRWAELRLRRGLLRYSFLQRQNLAHALHRGPCQSMSAAHLQAGWLKLCGTAAERREAEELLVRTVQQSATELRIFYELQLVGESSCRRWLRDRRGLSDTTGPAAAAARTLWLELLLCLQARDPDLEIHDTGCRARSEALGDPAVQLLVRLLRLLEFPIRKLGSDRLSWPSQ